MHANDPKKLSFALNSNFLINIYFQPDGVYLPYFKHRLCDLIEFIA